MGSPNHVPSWIFPSLRESPESVWDLELMFQRQVLPNRPWYVERSNQII